MPNYLERLYNYNTTKLFMFCVLFYFAGMFVVLIHDNSYISDGFKFSYDDKKFSNSKNFINNILFDMIYDRKSAVFCGLQAFLNLFFYNVMKSLFRSDIFALFLWLIMFTVLSMMTIAILWRGYLRRKGSSSFLYLASLSIFYLLSF